MAGASKQAASLPVPGPVSALPWEESVAARATRSLLPSATPGAAGSSAANGRLYCIRVSKVRPFVFDGYACALITLYSALSASLFGSPEHLLAHSSVRFWEADTVLRKETDVKKEMFHLTVRERARGRSRVAIRSRSQRRFGGSLQAGRPMRAQLSTCSGRRKTAGAKRSRLPA